MSVYVVNDLKQILLNQLFFEDYSHEPIAAYSTVRIDEGMVAYFYENGWEIWD